MEHLAIYETPNQHEIFNPFLPQQRWKKTSTYHPPRIWLNHRHPNLQNPETKQWLAGKWTGLKMVFPIENPHVCFFVLIFFVCLQSWKGKLLKTHLSHHF